MNATMIKGERSKLLAVAVILAMVACALVAIMPANEMSTAAVTVPEDAVEVDQVSDIGEESTYKLTTNLTLSSGDVLDIAGKTLYLNGYYIKLQGGTVSGGTIIGLDSTGIRTYAGTITGVTFEEVRSPIVIYDGISDDITISGCTFNDYTGAKQSASAIYAVLSDGHTITVSDCTFNGSYREGDINIDSQPTYSTKIVITTGEGKDVSINIVAENSDITIGNDDENAVNVAGASLDNVNVASGTLVIPENETLSANSVTSTPIEGKSATGNVSADTDQIDSDVISVPVYSSKTDTVTVYDFDSLISAIGSGTETIVLADSIEAQRNISLGDKTLDLNDNKISLGEYGITLGSGAIKNGTIAKTGGASSNGVAVSVSGDSAITDVDFVMTESAEGYMPFALSFDSGESTVTGCTFTADGARFGAIQNNFSAAGGSVAVSGCSFDNGIIVMKEFGKIDVVDSGQVILNIGLYGGNYDRAVSMNENTFTYSGTTDIVETMFGWDPSTIPPESTYQGNITLEVEGDYDLGEITLGAVNEGYQTNVLDVKSGDVTADGGYVNTLKIEQGASFDSTDMMKVELLTMFDASQVPENVYPSKVNVDSSTGERRPVASDFAVIQYVPTYYTGKTTDALYYIARPTNVNVSVVTILDTNDDISQKNVGDYTTDMRLSITYTYGDDDDQETTTVTLTFNWSILPAESQMGFNDTDSSEVVANPDDSTKITVNGEVTGTDGDYTIDIAIDPKAYDDKGGIVSIDSGYTLKFEDGSDVAVKGGNIITLPIDSLTDAEPVVIIYDADGDGANYAATKYIISFGELDATLAATIDVIDETEYGEWGLEDYTNKTIADFYDSSDSPVVFGTPELQKDGSYLIEVTGTLLYMESFDFYTATKSYGWYFPYYIQLPSGFDWSDVKITVTNNTTGATSERGPYAGETGDILPLFMKVGNKGVTVSIEFIFNDESYSIPKYILDLSGLEFETVSGYMDNGNASGVVKTETLNGITVDNVVGQTMWMIDNFGKYYDEELTYGVWYGDTLGEDIDVDTAIYCEDGKYTIWYFSFVDGVLTYQQDKGNTDYVAEPGLYTMKSWFEDGDGNLVEVGTAQTYMTGAYDTGFDSYSENVRGQIEGALHDTGFSDATADAIGEMNIRDRTMWMSYFQYGFDSGDYVLRAEITFDDKIIYTETMNSADGNRVFLVSFDDQLAKAGFDAALGEYTIAIVAYDADDADFEKPVSIVASDKLTISAEDSDVTFGNTPDYTEIWGMPIAMMQSNLRFDVDQSNNTVNVYGDVYYIDSFEEFWGAANDKPGYYFVFYIDALAQDLGTSNGDGFLWYDATVEVPDGSGIKVVKYDELDGTFIFYLGDDAFTQQYTIKVDFDGNVVPDEGEAYNAPFYKTTEYTINVEGINAAEPSYNLILSETENGLTQDYVYDEGELVMVSGSQWFTVHNGPNGNYATAYWMPSTYADGVWTPITEEKMRISADSTIDLAYYDALDGVVDYTVKLFVVYETKGTTGGSAATSYDVSAKLNEDGSISVSAVNNNGEQNAYAYFVYKVVVRSSTVGSDGIPVDKIEYTDYFGSGLVNGGPCTDSVEIIPNITIEDGWNVDVTLITLNGTIEVFYGTTTTTA